MTRAIRTLDHERLAGAFAYAAKLHRDQKRKGSDIPYISHLMAVASLVQEHGGSEDQVIVALLHDGPEDRGGKKTLELIRERFGDAVAKMVDECSDTFLIPKPPWRQRKECYLAHLPSASPGALLVSLADKVHNLRCIVRDYRAVGRELWTRFKGGEIGTLCYYEALLGAYEEAGAKAEASLLEEYRRTLSELRKLNPEAEPIPCSIRSIATRAARAAGRERWELQIPKKYRDAFPSDGCTRVDIKGKAWTVTVRCLDTVGIMYLLTGFEDSAGRVLRMTEVLDEAGLSVGDKVALHWKSGCRFRLSRR